MLSDREQRHLVLAVGAEAVDPHHRLLAPVHARLAPSRRLLDAQLRHPGLDGPGHPAEGLDLVDELARAGREARGEALDVVRPGEGVDGARDPGLVLEDELGVAGDAGGELAREGEGLVEGVGVQGLGAAEHRGEGPQWWCGRRCCTGRGSSGSPRKSGSGCGA